jgi:hypothetical protein
MRVEIRNKLGQKVVIRLREDRTLSLPPRGAAEIDDTEISSTVKEKLVSQGIIDVLDQTTSSLGRKKSRRKRG